MADAPTDVTDAPTAPADDKPVNDPIMDILMEGEEDTSKAEPSTAKKEETQVEKAETAEETKADDRVVDPKTAATTEEENKPVEGEEPTKEETPERPEQPTGKAEERKLQLNAEIRDLVSQRNALRTDIEKINAEFYQPATEEQLVESGLSPTDARIEALNQRLEVKDYNEKVADAQLTIEAESQAVLRDFPMFDQNNKDYNKDLANEAAELFNDSLIRDENTGQVIGSNLSVYKLYKALAASHGASVQAGQLKGQKATEKMLARADTTPDAPTKTAKKDPILAILEDVDGD
jgi:hypothetical protein